MIRQDKVHAISCTGANLEEDIFNLVAHDHYVRVPNYRDLTAEDEQELLSATSTASPTPASPKKRPCAAWRSRARRMEWADKEAKVFPPRVLLPDPLAAGWSSTTRSTPRTAGCWPPREKNLPIFVPGWEDSTLGNIFAGHVISGDIKNRHTVRTGIEYMGWPIGTGDVPRSILASSRSAAASPAISPSAWCPCCTGPADAGAAAGATSARSRTRPPATARIRAPCRTKRSHGTSFGIDTPKFIIESDATIVAPLIFAWSWANSWRGGLP